MTLSSRDSLLNLKHAQKDVDLPKALDDLIQQAISGDIDLKLVSMTVKLNPTLKKMIEEKADEHFELAYISYLITPGLLTSLFNTDKLVPVIQKIIQDNHLCRQY